MIISKQDVPPESLTGSAFADSLAKKFASQGGNPADLFVALAGVVCGKDQKLGADCLMALEGVIDGGANAETRVPSV
jgi:hypothetical protein